MNAISRRSFCRFVGASAFAGVSPYLRAEAQPSDPRIPSDVDRLRRVLVNPPSSDDLTLYAAGGKLVPLWLAVPPEAVDGHREMVDLLRRSGAEVLVLEEVLDAAIAEAHRQRAWSAWLSGTHPRIAENPDAVTAKTLLNRDPRFQFQRSHDGNYRHVIDPMVGMWYVRDVGVMTPRGWILCNFVSEHRRREAALFRFARQFAPQLRDYPIAFDAVEEGYFVEGGDIQVVDPKTLFVGVGNRTDPRVAPLLARRLEMDVVAVQTRKLDWLKPEKEPDPLHNVFLHLDTYFTHVGPGQALTLPWIFESRFAGTDPESRFIAGMQGQPEFDDEKAKKALEFVREVGVVRRFRGGTGEEEKGPDGEKIVDYVRSRGYTVHYVGGPPPEEPDLAHWFKVVFLEHERQAANVIATAPGEIIAFSGATRTHAALKSQGLRVSTINGRELWRGNGGPHCLTLPLDRG